MLSSPLSTFTTLLITIRLLIVDIDAKCNFCILSFVTSNILVDHHDRKSASTWCHIGSRKKYEPSKCESQTTRCFIYTCYNEQGNVVNQHPSIHILQLHSLHAVVVWARIRARLVCSMRIAFKQKKYVSISAALEDVHHVLDFYAINHQQQHMITRFFWSQLQWCLLNIISSIHTYFMLIKTIWTLLWCLSIASDRPNKLSSISRRHATWNK